MAENMTPSDVAAVMGNSDGFGNGAWWIVILFALIYGNGFGNNGQNVATQSDIQRAVDNGNMQRIGYEGMTTTKDASYNMLSEQRDLQNIVNNGFAAQATSNCETKQLLLENRYLEAQHAAEINANVDAKFAAMEIATLNRENAAKDARIAALENKIENIGTIKYPMSYAYTAGNNPFCNCGNGAY